MNEHITFDDIFDIWVLPWYYNPWVTLPIIFLVIIFLYFGYKFWPVQPYDPVKAAHKKLEELSPEKFLALEKQNKFYTELVLLIKKFLQEKYVLDIASYTEEELITFFGAQNLTMLPEEWVRELPAFLERAYIIKFTGAFTTHRTVSSDHALVRNLISLATKFNNKNNN